MLLHFFQRFSHVVLRFSCMSPCKKHSTCDRLRQTHSICDRRMKQSTESPDFDAPFWSENGVSCPHKRNKIGDSVRWYEMQAATKHGDRVGLFSPFYETAMVKTMMRVALCCVCIALMRSDAAIRLYHKIRQSSKYAPIRSRLFDYDRIDQHVLLGRQPRNEDDLQVLRGAGVSGILCFSQPWELHVDPDLYQSYSLERLELPTCDFGAPTMEQLLLGLSFINRHRLRGQVVYIHCNAGKGRSGVMAVVYYMSEYADKTQCTSYIASDAIRQVRNRRKVLSTLLDYYPLTEQARAVRTFAAMVKAPSD
jgi:hypothetical protein